MNNFGTKELGGLLQNLEDLLGRDSLLYHRLERGLRCESEHRLSEAMACLKLYPLALRRDIEDAVLTWLFGGKSTFGRRRAAPGGAG